ncbi:MULTISPECIES: ABC transporter permease [Psychrilyobacter]|uniref:ABC transporter permease subunit n=1 Tax=Psychrilyobacter piezotolerans TaxID=2293438 RepID=A0ABX9KJH6_9FUSO|nr:MULTISPECIES: ABC transporter permease [Psychrilyobacter]MCS5421755.1 ABC transporter permease [Psychrilyobacter sp. S5]NDI77060.1 ABC transporter permease [Psychrilyobacter piezotolerans]RDE64676.1 ABC transporter permease [Psychrilyobacter sp. S5]REI42488.1 ABC transporter permease subunit [Psychrilyobacter piezotolerans]
MNKIDFLQFLEYRSPEIFKLTGEHMKITGVAVFLAILVGVPLGIYITKNKKVANVILNTANIFQTLPSLALFGLIIPIMGIGFKPAIFVLFLYALLPIIKNTCIGINSIDPSIIEAGRGMGMTKTQILTMVEIPLALPIIMGGIRISTVINIGTATIAALIGAGGLGDFIFKGISMGNNNLILAGAIPTALLALSVDFILGLVEKNLTPQGLKNS